MGWVQSNAELPTNGKWIEDNKHYFYVFRYEKQSDKHLPRKPEYFFAEKLTKELNAKNGIARLPIFRPWDVHKKLSWIAVYTRQKSTTKITASNCESRKLI
jgi:hypothetical protein